VTEDKPMTAADGGLHHDDPPQPAPPQRELTGPEGDAVDGLAEMIEHAKTELAQAGETTLEDSKQFAAQALVIGAMAAAEEDTEAQASIRRGLRLKAKEGGYRLSSMSADMIGLAAQTMAKVVLALSLVLVFLPGCTSPGANALAVDILPSLTAVVERHDAWADELAATPNQAAAFKLESQALLDVVTTAAGDER
jgi:hypothetical protein